MPHTTPQDFYWFDANNYLTIAQHGYANPKFAAFFPLFPYLMRLLGQLIGLIPAGLVIPNVAFAAALVLFRAEAASHYDPRRADLATWALAVWPWSNFFTYPYTESLFLLLVVAAFRLMAYRQWVLAGLLGALAAATRAPGLLLVFAFGAEAVEAGRLWGRRRVSGPAIAALVTPIGLIAFAALLWRVRGDPFAFWHAEETWVIHRNLLFPVGQVLLLVEQQNPFKTESLGLPVVIMFAAGAWWVWQNLPRRYGVFTVVTVVFFAYQGWHLGQYHSEPRYLLADFPCFIAFGAFLARHDRFQVPWFVLSSALLTVESALYGAHHFIG